MSSFTQDLEEQPISRTYQYRKVMKPMLERKRRARINKYLDELKDLMVSTLQSEGENVTKLEKADVLELTVRHLHKLKQQQGLGLTPATTYADRFRAGFSHCANEVSRFLNSSVGQVDMTVSACLLSHLGTCIRGMESAPALSVSTQGIYTPPSSPVSSVEQTTTCAIRGQVCVVPVTTGPCSEEENRTGFISSLPSPISDVDSECHSPSLGVWRPW